MKDKTIRIHKGEIAQRQLETATFLFLNKIDFSSVITLSGAAGNILVQLVLNEGKRPFVDLGRDIVKYFYDDHLKRKSYKRKLELLFGIAQLKHMSPQCNEEIELDLEENAFKSLAVAITDFTTLYGNNEPFVKAFYNWSWVNKNGREMMKAYEDRPEKLKR